MYCDLPVNEIADGRLSWDSSEVQAHIQNLVWSEWWEDEENYLYIVEEEDNKVHGPDNEMADKIVEVLDTGRGAWELDEVIEGLTFVDYILRRFTVEEGFYHA